MLTMAEKYGRMHGTHAARSARAHARPAVPAVRNTALSELAWLRYERGYLAAVASFEDVSASLADLSDPPGTY